MGSEMCIRDRYITTMLSFFIPYLISMTIWTCVLSYNPPFPFLGLLVLRVRISVLLATVWFELPSRLKDTEGRKRILSCLICGIYVIMSSVSYFGVTIIIEILPLQMQWTVSIVLPIIKGIHTRVGVKLLEKSQPCNMDAMLVSSALYLESNNAFYEALVLADVTEETMYAMLGVQFLMHLYSCYEIIHLHNKVQIDNS